MGNTEYAMHILNALWWVLEHHQIAHAFACVEFVESAIDIVELESFTQQFINRQLAA